MTRSDLHLTSTSLHPRLCLICLFRSSRYVQITDGPSVSQLLQRQKAETEETDEDQERTQRCEASQTPTACKSTIEATGIDFVA
jgi:hypothetical protein